MTIKNNRRRRALPGTLHGILRNGTDIDLIQYVGEELKAVGAELVVVVEEYDTVSQTYEGSLWGVRVPERGDGIYSLSQTAWDALWAVGNEPVEDLVGEDELAYASLIPIEDCAYAYIEMA